MAIDPYYGFGSSSTSKQTVQTASSNSAKSLVAIQREEQSRAKAGETITAHRDSSGNVIIETLKPATNERAGYSSFQAYAPYSQLEPNVTLASGGVGYASPPTIQQQNFTPIPRETIEAYNAQVQQRNQMEQQRYNAQANAYAIQQLEAQKQVKPKMVGLGLAQGSEEFFQKQFGAGNFEFTRGFVGGVTGTVDLGVEAVKNPVRAGSLFVEGILGIPEALSKRPIYTIGSLTSSTLLAKGITKGGGAIIEKVGDYSGKAAEKVYSPNRLPFGTQEYYRYIAKPITVIKPNSIGGISNPIEIQKVSVPTTIEITRKAVIQAGEEPFLRTARTFGFGSSKEYVLKNPNIEIRPFAEGRFETNIETTKLTQTKTGIDGTIETLRRSGAASVERLTKPLDEPIQPIGDLFSLKEAARKSTKPETLLFSQGKSTIEGGTALIPKGYKPLSTEAAVTPPLEQYAVKLFPESNEPTFFEQISRPREGKAGLVKSGGLESQGYLFEEKTIVDITPRITNEAPKIYRPNYFSREAKMGGFYNAPKQLPTFDFFKVIYTGKGKALTAYQPKIEGFTVFKRLAITGSKAVEPTLAFKRFRPFSPYKGSEITKGNLEVTGSSGGSGTIVQQIYKARQRTIPKQDIIAKTIIETPLAKQGTTLQDILALQSKVKRVPKGTVDYGFEFLAYPNQKPSTIQNSVLTVSPISKLIGNYKTIENVSPIFREVATQKTNTKQTPSFASFFTTSSALTPATATRQDIAQLVVPRFATATAVAQATKQAQAQSIIEVTLPKMPTTQIFRGFEDIQKPKKPKKGNDEYEMGVYKFAKLTKVFDVFTKKGGKEVLLALNLPENKAMQLGANTVANTLRGSFQLKPRGFADVQDIPKVELSPDIFYSKSDKSGLTRYIERRQFRLNAPAELSEIFAARKRR